MRNFVKCFIVFGCVQVVDLGKNLGFLLRYCIDFIKLNIKKDIFSTGRSHTSSSLVVPAKIKGFKIST
jgi:hypothetical protein